MVLSQGHPTPRSKLLKLFCKIRENSKKTQILLWATFGDLWRPWMTLGDLEHGHGSRALYFEPIPNILVKVNKVIEVI